ncbi:MAG TPA: VCBS repeat-containing protein [Pyrinomonadaceae bacterium]|nr:VCBS repeat-containing protein [Pyrinomonadaceae bacterium]
MSKKKRNNRSETLVLDLSSAENTEPSAIVATELSKAENSGVIASRIAYLKKHWLVVLVICFLALGSFGAVMKSLQESAERQRLNQSSSGEETGGFLSRLNPLASAPVVTSTPQLSKEYIYAGSRLLAVEDANASAAPPADLAVWRPDTGVWWVLGGQGSQQTIVQWGSSTDQTAPGDYDGDGKTDFAVWRNSNGSGTWYMVNSSTSDSTQSYDYFGGNNDKVASADFDGDGKTDAGLFNTSTGMWTIRYSSGGNPVFSQFGVSGDIPTPADFDGDGKADLAVFRPSTTVGVAANFYVYRSSDGTAQTITFGDYGDKPVVADYDGDGRADAAVRKYNTGDWVIKQSSNNQTVTTNWGVWLDKEVQNDYDGDGRVDVAVWRPSTGQWWILNSSGGNRTVTWGQSGDIPVPAFYRR